MKNLRSALFGKAIVVIAPGKTASTHSSQIKKYIRTHNAIVITVNFLHDSIPSDFVYMSNVRRYRYWKNSPEFSNAKKIVTSNVMSEMDDNQTSIISFARLVKCGWEHLDNSTIMLFRLLDLLEVSSVAIAGLVGYGFRSEENYANTTLELANVKENPTALNEEIEAMLKDYLRCRMHNIPITFITPSRFEIILE